MDALWFYKHQHDNRVRSTQNAFSLPFAAILVNCAPRRELHNYCTPHIIKETFENLLIHRCNYILLSQVYCVWQVVKIPTIIFNNPVFSHRIVHRVYNYMFRPCILAIVRSYYKRNKQLYNMCVGYCGGNEISSYSSGWHGLGPLLTGVNTW
jgi:hypothetical protein